MIDCSQRVSRGKEAKGGGAGRKITGKERAIIGK